MFHRPFDGRDNFLNIEWFRYEIECAFAHGFDGGLQRPEAADKSDFDLGRILLEGS